MCPFFFFAFHYYTLSSRPPPPARSQISKIRSVPEHACMCTQSDTEGGSMHTRDVTMSDFGVTITV